MGKRVYKDITIDGVTYANAEAIAKAKGVTVDAVHKALQRGTEHRIGNGHGGVEPMPVRIRGQVFSDAEAAAKHFGITANGIRQAIRCGREDRVGLAPTGPTANARAFKIGTLTFQSMREASIALGFKTDTYIAKVMRKGSARGKQRILAAAMKYAERLQAENPSVSRPQKNGLNTGVAGGCAP
ncbi:hypothetical protein [Ruegeria sp. ANG-R]|uniref:hypothetical protein n=1 Tax=Ruegeria sp. ANG-R TaxID=1577903 RepID=UPI00057DD0ED|nr:hypothetical protein [Ruegeria sp. ANG-R]